MSDGPTIEEVCAALAGSANTPNEAALQLAIDERLRAKFGDDAVQREFTLRTGDRIDFMVGDVGIEVKVRGSRPRVLAQLERYAKSYRLDGLVLVATRGRYNNFPAELGGKPLRVVHLKAIL